MRRWWFRIGLALLGALGSYVGMSVLLFTISASRASLSQQPHEWLPLHVLEPNRRLLIIAPHPDDEVLGCGGLIAEAVARGIPVKIIWLTTGDGFPGAAMLVSRATPDAQAYQLLGKTRIQEAQHACQALGVPRENLCFLGYPDRRLWAMALSGERPVRSPSTGYTQVAYDACPNRARPYTAPNLVADLREAITAFQPTDIFTSHPLDDHPDHMAGALFTMEAIRQAVQSGGLTRRPGLYYYLVHRGNWPLPQGDHPNRTLLPPVSMGQSGWYYFPLTPDTLERKRAALEAHATQYALMIRFLTSFLRQNELFQQAEEPVLYYRNPVDDNPALHLRPEGDISVVQIEPERHGLEVKITTRKPIEAPFQIELNLITVDSRGRWSRSRWVSHPNNTTLPAQVEGHTVRLWLSRPNLGTQRAAYLVVQTRLYGVELDRSGVLPIPLSDAGWDSPARATALLSAPSHSH